MDDIDFIFKEADRIMTGVRQGLHPISEQDMFYDLPHPSGRGHLICGYEAGTRIDALAEEALRRQKMNNRIRLETSRRAMKDVLVRYFLQEKREITVSSADKAINAAGKIAIKACTTRTHYLPCHLMLTSDPDKIQLGPVTFFQKVSFRKHIAPKVRAYRSDPAATDRNWHRQLLQDALKYYKEFQWVAQVEIEDCDKETSVAIAERAVTAALDCLHLLFGAQSTDKMRIGGPRLSRDTRARLGLMSSGELDVSLSSGLMGQVNFRAGWSAILEKPNWKDILGLCGIALEAAVHPDLARPVSRRFLDAASWFGEAARETSPAAKIVKYVTALERMVMTDEKDDIARLVSERVAALNAAFRMTEDQQTCAKDAKEIYDLRSKLVHGSMSPYAAEVRQGIGMAAKLGSSTLLSALCGLGDQALRRDDINTRKLAKWYDDVVRYQSENERLETEELA